MTARRGPRAARRTPTRIFRIFGYRARVRGTLGPTGRVATWHGRHTRTTLGFPFSDISAVERRYTARSTTVGDNNCYAPAGGPIDFHRGPRKSALSKRIRAVALSFPNDRPRTENGLSLDRRPSVEIFPETFSG